MLIQVRSGYRLISTIRTFLNNKTVSQFPLILSRRKKNIVSIVILVSMFSGLYVFRLVCFEICLFSGLYVLMFFLCFEVYMWTSLNRFSGYQSGSARHGFDKKLPRNISWHFCQTFHNPQFQKPLNFSFSGINHNWHVDDWINFKSVLSFPVIIIETTCPGLFQKSSSAGWF